MRSFSQFFCVLYIEPWPVDVGNVDRSGRRGSQTSSRSFDGSVSADGRSVGRSVGRSLRFVQFGGEMAPPTGGARSGSFRIAGDAYRWSRGLHCASTHYELNSIPVGRRDIGETDRRSACATCGSLVPRVSPSCAKEQMQL